MATTASPNKRPREEEQEAEEKLCRICFGGEEDGPLVQKCGCRGSAGWVHEDCLATWRRTGVNEDAAIRCGQCHDSYRDELSIEILRERLQERREEHGDDHEDTIDAMEVLGYELSHWHPEHFDEGCELLQKVLTARRGSLGDRHEVTFCAMALLCKALLLNDDLEAAEQLLLEAFDSAIESFGARDQRTTNFAHQLSILHIRREEYSADVETFCRSVFEIALEEFGERDPNTFCYMGTLATVLYHQGKLEEAEQLKRRSLKLYREVKGNRHPQTISMIVGLADLLEKKGDLVEAKELFRESLATNLAVHGPKRIETRISLCNVYEILKQRSPAEALAFVRESGVDIPPSEFADELEELEHEVELESITMF